jgi:hypothetical protein
MSDIFISYSKADRALALKLSAFLEAEGWSVWWDKSLGAADLYRDEIMKQLAAARAVITIWTENSVKSDWVRAEAGRAKAEGKLIPVKTPDVAYADIPLPFGEMHTENLESSELIRAAIVAQLTKPSIPLSPFWQITSTTFKYQVLTWVGIVGAAITLFANFKGVLDFADWARELVAHWHEWNQIFWGWAFSWIGLRVPREFVPTISFIASVGLLIAGVNLSARTVQSPDKLQDAIPLMRKVKLFIRGLLLYVPALLLALVLIGTGAAIVAITGLSDSPFLPDLMEALGLVIVIGPPMGYLVYVSQERSWAFVNSLLFMFMAGCLLYLPLWDGAFGFLPILFSMCLFQICWMAVILLSPIRQLTRRLTFVVVGVLTLIALSEISKLNLHQYLQPPKVS